MTPGFALVLIVTACAPPRTPAATDEDTGAKVDNDAGDSGSPEIGGWTHVGAAVMQTCGIDLTGAAHCWGEATGVDLGDAPACRW